MKKTATKHILPDNYGTVPDVELKTSSIGKQHCGAIRNLALMYWLSKFPVFTKRQMSLDKIPSNNADLFGNYVAMQVSDTDKVVLV